MNSWIELLRQRARAEPEHRIYTFLSRGETETAHLAFADLERQARAIGALLQAHGASGARALLLYPPGLDFITAFFGALFAGAIAVPAYPPRPGRGQPRLRAIARDAAPRVVLTTSKVAAQAAALAREIPELGAAAWLSTPDLDPALAVDWRDPGAGLETLAFLQYTSGSTADPKGVMVSHGNLLHNQKMIRRAFGQSERSVIVGWLPLYHDMGLIGNVLQPLYVGGQCVLMSPLAFLQRPLRWLEAVSAFRGTTSGGPNFAYDFCVRKVRESDRERLDLSSWTLAFNGAEPVRADTMERFAAAFAGCGFDRRAFYPCYGLAEATLFVSGGEAGRGPVRETVQALELEKGRAVPALGSGGPLRDFVGCGSAWLDQEIRIADPATPGVACLPGQVGEIQVAGPSVALGYWNRPEETAANFIESADGGRFLRTGDLGFLRAGELFITGRLKDLIILRGRNLYPQDVERTAEESHPALRPGCSAAFACDGADGERLVLVCEIERGSEGRLEETAAAVRESVAGEHEAQVQDIVFLPEGEIPKTSSGKIQRRLCHARYLAGDFPAALGRSGLAGAAEAPVSESGETAAEDAGRARLEDWLRKRVAHLFSLAADAVAPGQRLTSLGLDSLSAVELQHALATELAVTVDIADLLAGPTVRELASALVGRPAGAPRPAGAVSVAAGTAGGEVPLAHGQRALWFLQRLEPEATAYNVAAAVRIRSPLDPEALRRAWELLAERHPALRASFVEAADGPEQRILTERRPDFSSEDAAGWSAERLREQMHAETHRPFDLERDPLLRVRLFRLAAGEHAALLVVHHIVADLWSLGVLARELGALVSSLQAGVEPLLGPPPFPYAAAAERRLQELAADGERLWGWWRERLAGELPVAELPADRPRPPQQSFHGGSRSVWLDRGLAEGLQAAGGEHRATFFMTLLAAFEALLCRYSGQTDLLVGSPTAGRESPNLAGVVGYFVNPVVLRTDLSGEPTFGGLIERVRETVLGAFRHQAYPFPLLVERLQPQRDPSRSPLFQVMFVLQRAHLAELRDLAAFALGQEGARVDVGGLALESLALEQRAAQFDLELMAAETGRGLALTLIYDAGLFDAATAGRALGHLETLLRAAAADPGSLIARLPLLTTGEQRQLATWNHTAAALPAKDGRSFPELFAEQAGRTPEAIAAEAGSEAHTYAELNARAERLAGALLAAGGRAEEPVAVWAERGLDSLTAVLAVLRAGCAYLPLDPRQPARRLVRMVERSGCRIVLCAEPWLDACRAALSTIPAAEASAAEGAAARALPLGASIRAGGPSGALPAAPAPEQLAYILFTSGSTGAPKGAMIVHRGLLNHLEAKIGDLGLGPADRVAQTAAATFDISIWQLLAPLLSGGCVRIVPDATAGDPALLLREVEEHSLTVLELVPSLLRALLQEIGIAPGASPALMVLRWMVPTGEALPPDLCRDWLARYPAVPLINAYGPTECSDDVTHHVLAQPLPAGAARVPVGRPVPNLRLHVMDRELALVPVGVPGEFGVAGVGVGRGYLGEPGRTAEVFVPDPFSPGPGGRLYRTGDLGLRRPDGVLEFLGRFDHQVKIRGHRIELGEIEAELATHPAVRETVVMARRDERGEPRLAAYWTARPEDLAPPDPAALRRHLRQRLPEAMIPAAFVRLAALPLTPNGKVDRKALPKPAWSAGAGPEPLARRDEIETLIAGVFAEVLGRERVGAGQSFFEVGGHSLLATQAASRLRRSLGIDLPLRALFEAPTPAALAAHVRARQSETAATAVPPLNRAPRPPRIALSFAQQRLWFVAQLEPASPEYNMPGEVRLSGPLRLPALAASLAAAVRRHEALRTVFRSAEGTPWQEVLPAVETPLPCIDITALPAAARERCAAALAYEESRRPFDLQRGPLLRAALLRLGAEEHRLLFMLHHIVSDGWSQGVLVREISALYRALAAGTSPELPELPVQYADFAQWQREWLQGEVLAAQLSWWRGALGRDHQALELPLDRPRPPRRTHRGARRAARIPEPAAGALHRLARREGATTFMGLLALFQALLHRLGGQNEVRVGSPIANRRWQEIEELIGFFVNTLVLRADFASAPTLRELLAQAREAALGAYAHQDVPFERLVDELQPERDLGRTPLFQAMLILQNAPLQPLTLTGLALSLSEIDNGTAKFELTLSLEEMEDGLCGWLEHNTDLFDVTTAERFLAAFGRLLEAGVAEPDRPLADLPLLGALERHQLLHEWNDSRAAVPTAGTVHRLFAAQAQRTPAAVALSAAGAELTYRELAERSNRLARHLQSMGVAAETPVAIWAERTADTVVGLLAILEAGGAYVPLDPGSPLERMRVVLGDSGARFVLVPGAAAGALPAHPAHLVPLDLPLDGALPADRGAVALRGPWQEKTGADGLAYILFTSGSTGRPKGVEITHRALVNLLASVARLPGLAGQTLLAVTTLSFDIAGADLYLPLVTGGRVVLADRDTVLDGARLAAAIARSGATVMQATPATWSLLLDAGWPGAPHLTAISTGEALPRDLARALRPRVRALWNLYGPTETTIWSAGATVAADHGVPIGRPVANTVLRVLDPRREMVPAGAAGELCIGGAGVARGYRGRPDLNAERFVPDPLAQEPGARLYRTGDLVRWLPDGRLDYLGRIDQQVKIRGFRIELEEIESVLAAHPGVARAVAAVRGEGTDRQLVAYVVPAGAAPEARALQEHLRVRLPEYMIPAVFVTLEALPLTPNGKVDRRALPDPGPLQSAAVSTRALAGPVEELVAAVWSQVLGADRIGADDSFFALGGHSLLATRVISRLNEAFGADLPLHTLFEAPTVAGLARALESARRERTPVPPLARVPRGGPSPVSFSQERLWFLDQLDPGSPVYNVFQALRLTGPLDDRVLERCFAEVVRRHEALRTTFTAIQGRPMQVVGPVSFGFERIDLTGLEPARREAEAKRRAREAARRPFDLRHGPLLRAALLDAGLVSGEMVRFLVLVMHHIVCDDWSVGLLVSEVGVLYRDFRQGLPSPLPELPVQYADFAQWQRSWLSGDVLAAEVEHWQRQLAGELPVLELPLDRPRPPVPSHLGALRFFALPADLCTALRRLAAGEGATLFMALLSGYAAALHRLSGQDGVVIGSPVAGRNRLGTEPLIGLFVNVLPLRLEPGRAPSYRALLQQVRRVALDAYDHQEVPFERLVEALQIRRDLSRPAIRQTGFAFQDVAMQPIALAGVESEPVHLDIGVARLDLTLFAWPVGDGLHGACEYATDLFLEPAIDRLLGLFRSALEDMAADAERPLLALPRSSAADEARPRPQDTNLTEGQLLFWFANQLQPGVQLYFDRATTTFTLEGPLDQACFERAFHKLYEICAVLRSLVGEVDGMPWRTIPNAPSTPLEIVDLTGTPDPEAAYRQWLAQRCAEAIGLEKLIDTALLHIAPQRTVWFFNIHHLIADAWSIHLLGRHLSELYDLALRGALESARPLPSYDDFVAEERAFRQSDGYRRARPYWERKLARPVAANLFYRKAGVPFATPTERRSVELDAAASDAVRALAARARMFSPAVVFAAALFAFLHRLNGERPLRIGTPFANRPERFRGTVGLMMNACPVQVEVAAGETFASLLARLQQEIVDSSRHQNYPIRNRLDERAWDVYFNYQSVSFRTLCGLPVRFELHHSGHSNDHLDLQVSDFADSGRFRLDFDFNRTCFDSEQAARSVGHYLHLLRAFLADTGLALRDAPLLGEDERTLLLGAFNATERRFPQEAVCLHHLIEAQAGRTPEAPAVTAAGLTISYRELDERANRLARFLRAAGLGLDARVGVAMERSIDLVVALVGTLKAGAAYVPIDLDYPDERIAYMLEDSQVPVLLTQNHLLPRRGAARSRIVALDAEQAALAAFPATRLDSGAGAESAAYMIYTSGSTGRPKGVVIPHAGICNRLLWMQEEYGLTAEDSVLQKTPFSFDVSVWEFFWPLITGARLVMAEPGGHQDPAYLTALIAREEITTLHFVPSMLQVFLEQTGLGRLRSLQRVICSGEALPEALRARFYERLSGGLHNLYGPTEASVDVSAWACPEHNGLGVVPIGRPIANTRILLLDLDLNLVPPGIPGELHIGGIALARGYFARPELTAAKFVPDPFGPPGSRLYKTGDLARHLTDGTIEYLGRLDHQVKIRGFRIELGEIEVVLAQFPGVREVVVLAREDRPGQPRLVAYFVPEPGWGPTAIQLRGYAQAKLPEHMVPAALVAMDAMPLTPSGKVDRRALPPPELDETAAAGSLPRTPLEALIAQIWCEVLGIESVGVDANFFDMGGNSLLATQVVGMVQDVLPVKLSLRRVFDRPTVTGLAAVIEDDRSTLGEQEQQVLSEILIDFEQGMSGL